MSHIEEQFCSLNKKLGKICGNLFENFKKQIELQFPNELKKLCKRITRIWQNHASKSDFGN